MVNVTIYQVGMHIQVTIWLGHRSPAKTLMALVNMVIHPQKH